LRIIKNFRFGGDLWAVLEGTALFANEPFLRIEALLWQAQLSMWAKETLKPKKL